MKKLAFLSMAIFMLGSISVKADEDRHHHDKHFRLDCRFYDHNRDDCDKPDCDHKCSKPKHCVVDALYEVSYDRDDEKDPKIKDIKYGVRCDDEIVFSNEGRHFATTLPDGTTEDHIRPLTSNVPETVILTREALLHPGTYQSDLFLEQKKMKDGSCDVMEVEDQDHRY